MLTASEARHLLEQSSVEDVERIMRFLDGKIKKACSRSLHIYGFNIEDFLSSLNTTEGALNLALEEAQKQGFKIVETNGFVDISWNKTL